MALALISAVLLGLYDVLKKLSLNGNAVLPVLFLSTITAAVTVAPFVFGSAFFPDFFNPSKCMFRR
ncbi:MAG: hypothetical protein ACK5HT_21590 [Draconibacterium sp.]